jgi:hypothetical protein
MQRKPTIDLSKYPVYACLLGFHESHRYVFQVTDENDLKAELSRRWPSMNGEWAEQEVPSGYPTKSRRFAVVTKGRGGYAALAHVCYFPDMPPHYDYQYSAGVRKIINEYYGMPPGTGV